MKHHLKRLAYLKFILISCHLQLGCSQERTPIVPSPIESPQQPAPVEEIPPPEDLNVTEGEFGVVIRDRRLYVHGRPFVVKGVNWNPVRKGFSHPEGLIYRHSGHFNLEAVARDLRMMAEAGINTVRTYDIVTDPSVLNLLSQNGIYVIVPVYNYHRRSQEDVRYTVQLLRNHPTTLFWEIGNEWNYNHFYNPSGHMADSIGRVHQMSALVRSLDHRHPISSSFGELPSKALVDELRNIDVWGLNVYSGISFGNRFARWASISNKPIYMSEYGADAVDARRSPPAVDPRSQATAVRALTLEIKNSLSIYHSHNFLLGGAVFEWNDEWWKAGNPNAHDMGGVAPGGGPYPDGIFNEEWFGIVDIDRNRRPAYYELQEIYRSLP